MEGLNYNNIFMLNVMNSSFSVYEKSIHLMCLDKIDKYKNLLNWCF